MHEGKTSGREVEIILLGPQSAFLESKSLEIDVQGGMYIHVCLRMMSVMLKSPRFIRIYQWHKSQGSNNIFNQLIP